MMEMDMVMSEGWCFGCRLESNQIGDEGAKGIGDGLKTNGALQTLTYVKREREEWVGWDV